MNDHFWHGFEKSAGLGARIGAGAAKLRSAFNEAYTHGMGTGAAHAAETTAQAAAKPVMTFKQRLQSARTFGKGALVGGALTAGGLAVANANRRANENAMVPMGQGY